MDYEDFHRGRLLNYAREHVEALRHDGRIVGVIAGGSLAHGGADRESDLDLLIVVEDLPSPETRAGWLTRITGLEVHPASLSRTEERGWDEFHTPRDDPEQWMGTGGGLFYVPEAEVGRDIGRVADLLVAFLERGDVERLSHAEESLADLAHGIILHDPRKVLAAWQQRLADYPESARTRLINHHWRQAEIAINEDIQRAVWRSDFLHAYDRRVEGVRHLVRMLFAMNRRYFRKGKSLHRLLPTFPTCPPDAWPRLIAASSEPDHMRAAAILLTLARDTIDLIEPPEVLDGREHWRKVCASWAEQYGLDRGAGSNVPRWIAGLRPDTAL